MLRKMVSLPDEKLSKDATDALAVAWCHLMKQNNFQDQAPKSKKKLHQNNSNSSWKDFVADNPDRVKE
jgi:crossover junction endodeoxyribonuclease RuvC